MSGDMFEVVGEGFYDAETDTLEVRPVPEEPSEGSVVLVGGPQGAAYQRIGPRWYSFGCTPQYWSWLAERDPFLAYRAPEVV